MRLLKSLSLSILILIVYSLSMNAQNDHFIKTNENQKHDSKTLDTDPPSDSNVQERRNVPFISLIIISDVAAIHADIDPATRWPEIQGRKTNQNLSTGQKPNKLCNISHTKDSDS